MELDQSEGSTDEGHGEKSGLLCSKTGRKMTQRAIMSSIFDGRRRHPSLQESAENSL